MSRWLTPSHAQRMISDGRGEGVRIAILDSGVETSHPDLRGLKLADDVAILARGASLRLAPNRGKDVFGHGTAVAGVLREVAPRATLGSFRVLGEDNSSKSVIIQRAAREAIERGYHILNCSFGCGVESHVLIYKQWVDEAYQRGRHVVAACNNMDFSSPEWPAFFPSVIAVNMAQIESPTRFYLFRQNLVEFAARGVNVSLPWAGNERKIITGSSFAAPRIAALLARLISQAPGLPPLEAKAMLHRLAHRWRPGIAGPNVPDPAQTP